MTRFRLQRRWLAGAIGLCAVVVVAGILASVHYVQVARLAEQNRLLRSENAGMLTELETVRARIQTIGTTLDRVQRFDKTLRLTTLPPDVQPVLPIGPTEPKLEKEPGPELENPLPSVPSEESLLTLSFADKLERAAISRENSLQELQAYFQDQKFLLAATPSIWPVHGTITSDFGPRLDPITAEPLSHPGLDIAGPFGRQVISPANGVVVFAGPEGGYGNVIVIDHGRGIKTRYGHLSMIRVRLGEKVGRGQPIAETGTSGHSTGPHLHYEVRINGVAQNPRKFILDE